MSPLIFESAPLPFTFCIVAVHELSQILRQIHIGKEGYPTRNFSVTVDNRGRVLNIHGGFQVRHELQTCTRSHISFMQMCLTTLNINSQGSWNDKSTIAFDDILKNMSSNPLFTETEFQLLDEHGNPFTVKGLWALVDGGYQPLPCLINPFKFPSGTDHMRWSEWAGMHRNNTIPYHITFSFFLTTSHILLFHQHIPP